MSKFNELDGDIQLGMLEVKRSYLADVLWHGCLSMVAEREKSLIENDKSRASFLAEQIFRGFIFHFYVLGKEGEDLKDIAVSTAVEYLNLPKEEVESFFNSVEM